PGYAFRLTSVQTIGTSAVIEVEWLEPSPDAVLAQVMTHPCLVVGIESAGYDTLTVSDQNGVLDTIDL
ncbi:MAG: protease complex subunit PrcB family protein, partial [Pseudomonadales bacterium]